MNDQANNPHHLPPGTLSRLIEEQPMKPSVVVTVGADAVHEVVAALPYVARREGMMVCVDLFSAGGGGSPTREEFLEHIRSEGFGTYVTLVEGRGGALPVLLADEAADLVYIHDPTTYDDLRDAVLEWLPKVRRSGTLCGTLPALPAEAGDYLALLGAQPTEAGSRDDRGALRAVMELLPGARWEGPTWWQRKGHECGLILDAATVLRRSIETQRRASELFRETYCDAFKAARDSEDRATRIAILEQLVREYPGSLDPHIMLGNEYLALQRPDLAIQVFRRPLKDGTGNTTLYAHLGMAYAALGDAGGAETYFKTALRLDHTNMPAWLNLLIHNVQQGAVDEARECLEHALSVAQPDPETAALLAKISLAIQEPEGMKAALDKLWRLDPGHELVQKLHAALQPPATGWQDPTDRFMPIPSETTAETC